MPEGDTVRAVADYLGARLTGRALVDARLRGDPTLDLRGRRVERVDARGKHLLVHVEDGWLLRSHLGMHGSWHRYRPGEAWRRPRRHAALVLETADDVLVCFHAEEAVCLRAEGRRAREELRRLGPDLTADAAPDLDAIVARARALLDAGDPVVDVLLHQGVACGIGNVHKSEALHQERIDPRTPLGALDDARLHRLYERARANLLAARDGGPRSLRAGGRTEDERHWVYRRAGRPCHACGQPIARLRFGRHQRSTYWCPECQGSPARPV